MKRYAALIAPLSIRILTIGMREDVDVPRMARVLRSTCQMRKARSATHLLQMTASSRFIIRLDRLTRRHRVSAEA